MERTIIAVLLLLAVGLSTGCGKDSVQPDGTKVFGERTLRDGTVKTKRIEFPNGQKGFDVTLLPDGTEKIEQVELPSGEKQFDFTRLPDGTQKIARAAYPDGTEKLNIVHLPKVAETKPSHLSFRGLHAGLSKKEVWDIVKANVEDADFLNIANDPKTYCKLDKSNERGWVWCEGGHSSLVFSREDKLIKFQVSIFHYNENPDGFFAALSKELAANNGESTESAVSDLRGDGGTLPVFSWQTDQTVGEGCMDDPKGNCPSEKIIYLEQGFSRNGRADIEFVDNRYFKMSVWCPTCPV